MSKGNWQVDLPPLNQINLGSTYPFPTRVAAIKFAKAHGTRNRQALVFTPTGVIDSKYPQLVKAQFAR